MKRFRFTLQPIAVLRAHRESRAREVLAAALQAAAAAEEKLASTRQRVARFEAALSAGRRGRFRATEEAHQLHGYRREAAAENEAEKAAVTARAAVHRRQAEYLAAHRELEVVRRFEAKARQAHRAAGHREEQAEFDEFATRAAATARHHRLSP